MIKKSIDKHHFTERLKLGDVLDIKFDRGIISFDVTRLGYFEAWHSGIEGRDGDVIITDVDRKFNSRLVWEDRLLESIRLGKIIRR